MFKNQYLFLVVLSFCSSFSAQAQMQCLDVFYSRPKLTLPGRQTPPKPIHNSETDRSSGRERTRLLNDSTQVSRDPELLRTLIKNRKYHSLTRNQRGQKIRWFLSLSENGRLYRTVAKYNNSDQVIDIFADEPTVQVQKTYFHSVVETLNLEPLSTEINLPRKGKRELIIQPSILVKLDVKHDISEDMLLTALRRIPKHIKYRPNLDPKFDGKDSFIIFLDLGFRTPLEVVLLHNDNTYSIVTAFFPDVYRY